jgi:hypothetical protein
MDRRTKPEEEPHHSIDHLQNLTLHELKILGVTSRGAADDVVDSTVVVFSTHAPLELSANVPEIVCDTDAFH